MTSLRGAGSPGVKPDVASSVALIVFLSGSASGRTCVTKTAGGFGAGGGAAAGAGAAEPAEPAEPLPALPEPAEPLPALPLSPPPVPMPSNALGALAPPDSAGASSSAAVSTMRNPAPS